MSTRVWLIAPAALALLVPPSAAPYTVAIDRPGGAVVATAGGDAWLDAARDLTIRNVTRPAILVRAERPVRAGEYATIHVTKENIGGDGETTHDFGDGSGTRGVALIDTGCGGYRRGARQSFELRHAFRYAGTYRVTVSFVPNCHTGWGKPIVGYGDVEVTEATTPSNGPEQPVFHGLGPHAYLRDRRAPLTVVVEADYVDADGYLTEIRYYWGDGSPDTVYRFPLARCVDPPATWPGSAYWDDDGAGQAVHTYPARQRYRAVVIATFAGCDGRDVQTVKGDTLVRLDEPGWE